MEKPRSIKPVRKKNNRGSIRPWIGIVLATFLLCACKSQQPLSNQNEARLTQHYIPVLKGTNNDILELVVDLDVTGMLKEMQISVTGEEGLLSGVQVYQLIGEGDQQQKLPVAAMGEAGTLNTIEINKELAEGSHRFLISVIPNPDASLYEKFEVNVPNLVLENGQVQPIVEGDIKPLRLGTKLRHHGDDGVHSYRIPGLVTSMEGTLLAVYDIRRENSRDLQGDIDVGLSRSTDGGKSWEPMKNIMDMGEWGGKPERENGIGDPAILVDHQTNTIWVSALWAHGKPDQMLWNSSESGMEPGETGQLMLVKSEDDGVSWSKPVNITSQIKDPKWTLMFNGPGKGVTMRDGTLVFAGQYKDEDNMPHSTIIYSRDKGETWHIGTGAKANTTEAQVVELNDGSLMLNMRDNAGGSRSVAVTTDMGQTWTEHPSSRSALIEPVCMASLITYPENRITEDASVLFFSNPATTEGRYNITLKASMDEGHTWPEAHHVLLDSKHGWGYSCLTVIDEDHLGILYESSQANMTFQIIPIQDLISDFGQ